MYVYNGVALATGLTPQHVDHPGTSLQWLVGIVSRVASYSEGFGGDAVAFAVQNPELVLRLVGGTQGVVFALALGALGYRLVKCFGGVPGIAVVLAVMAASKLTLPWIVVVTPEAIVLIAAVLCLTLLIPSLADRDRQPNTVEVVGVSLLIALGMTAKITFLPFLVLLPFVLKLRQLFLVAVTSGLFTLLILVPVYPVVPKMLTWFLNLAGSSARYSGASQNSRTENLLAALGTVTENYWLTWIFLGIWLAVLVLTLNAQSMRPFSRWQLPGLGVASALTATLLLGLKDSVTRDFILVAALAPLLLGLALSRLRMIDLRGYWAWLASFKLSRAVPLSILGLLAAVSTLSALQAIETQSAIAVDRAVEYERETRVEGTTIESFLAPSARYAAMMGDEWAHHPFSEQIFERYPDFLYYNPWWSTLWGPGRSGKGEFLNCDGVKELLEKGPLTAILPGDLSQTDSIELGSIALNDDSALKFHPSEVRLTVSGYSIVPIVGCAASPGES